MPSSLCSSLSKFGIVFKTGVERDLIDSITQNASIAIRYEDFVQAIQAAMRYEAATILFFLSSSHLIVRVITSSLGWMWALTK